MRRARKLGDQHLRIEVGTPKFDDQRLNLFNAHRMERNLSRGEAPADASDYTSFLVNALCEVWELSFWYGEDLVAISITDVAATSLSAVYCFFDPKYSWLSPGTYAILSQITLTQSIDYKWLYLGMYVRDNQHLCYKSRYGPHERFIDGQWRAFP
jgi:leucyl-tRNA---protein transferase